jgi:diadenosine tetraphosphate (Ap4A) HIT family hydrolase
MNFVPAHSSFMLDPRLQSDTLLIADWALCRVLLMQDARFPWLILVPRRPQLTELIDLDADEEMLLMQEMRRASQIMRQLFRPDKINIAALGNVVAQLHVHVVARFQKDEAWPQPIWGYGQRRPYMPEALAVLMKSLHEAFAG